MNTTLDRAPLNEALEVIAVSAPPSLSDWAVWLAELGFTSGERVALKTRAWPGGDPLVVRIGASTFALRAAEAACVQVRPLGATA